MRTKFVIAAGLAALWAAEGVSGADTRALVGATREEILAHFGEPKSHIVAGNREVLIFANERVTLRDNRAVEIDDLPTEPPPPPAPAPAPAAPATSVPADTATDTTGAPTPAAHNTTPAASASATADATGNATVAPTPVAPPPPQVVIKSVRPPSHTATASSSSTNAPSSAPAETAPTPKPTEAAPATAAPAVATAPAAVSTPSSAAVADVAGNSAAQPSTPTAPATAPDASAAPAASVTATTGAPVANDAAKPATDITATAAAPKSAAPASAAKPVAPAKSPAAVPVAEPDRGSHRFIAIAIGVIVVCIGYLYWRRRQRAALLAATAVSRSPFAPPSVATAAAATNAAFSADLLAKLEWKRFEELVAAYYNKTGVVATRTKSGPMSPVHIKISWKGEQRPFACVQCHAHPPGLLDAKPVQSLVDALAAEDIRRGYVVTSGKFGVPARDLAEEKHITLLSGDLFLDKLNALPEPARAELLREATSGDYSTPSCPTCESKMTRAIGESAWSCPQCGTTLARG